MSDRVDQLEYTVMELGAEIFRMKQELNQMSAVNENMLSALKKLQIILDEKGIIDSEEFDLATNFNQLFRPFADSLDELDEENIPSKTELH